MKQQNTQSSANIMRMHSTDCWYDPKLASDIWSHRWKSAVSNGAAWKWMKFLIVLIILHVLLLLAIYPAHAKVLVVQRWHWWDQISMVYMWFGSKCLLLYASTAAKGLCFRDTDIMQCCVLLVDRPLKVRRERKLAWELCLRLKCSLVRTLSNLLFKIYFKHAHCE